MLVTSYRSPAGLLFEHTREGDSLFRSMPLASYFFNYFLNTFFLFFSNAFLFLFSYSLNIYKEFFTFSEILFTHGMFTHVL